MADRAHGALLWSAGDRADGRGFSTAINRLIFRKGIPTTEGPVSSQPFRFIRRRNPIRDLTFTI